MALWDSQISIKRDVVFWMVTVVDRGAQQQHTSTKMKFLVLLALVAAASARPEYHDDVFHFSSLQGLESLRGLSRASVQKLPSSSVTQVNTYSAQPVQVFKSYSSPAVTQIKKTTYSAQPVQVFNAYSSAPAVTQIKKTTYSAQPIQVLKTFSAPAVTQVNTYSAQPVQVLKTISTPAVTQVNTYATQPAQVLKSYSAPAYSQVSSSSAYSQQPNFRILKQVQEHDPLGYYRFNYETENGIQAKENGILSSQSGPEGSSVITEGSYSYTGPDGVVYTVTYTADENGFQAAGEHLPTPPPIPAEILRSLEIQGQLKK